MMLEKKLVKYEDPAAVRQKSKVVSLRKGGLQSPDPKAIPEGRRQELIDLYYSVDALRSDVESADFAKSLNFAVRHARDTWVDRFLDVAESKSEKEDHALLAFTAHVLLKAVLFFGQEAQGQDQVARKKLAILAAAARADGDPKVVAMRKIKTEWMEMKNGGSPFRKDAQFAREAISRHPVIESEGSIRNAISRWRKEASSS
ncbi:hypothetical protein HDC36_003411 [Xanthomonas sp. JAI131]|nr:hypothetical protein [Xanthomonas sp. JAI131]